MTIKEKLAALQREKERNARRVAAWKQREAKLPRIGKEAS